MAYQKFHTAALAALLLLPLAAGAQSLPAKVASIEEITPKGWTTGIATGDLNKDGVDDVALITIPDFEKGIFRRDDGYEKNLNQPILAIYFGIPGQGYTKWRQYDDILELSDEYVTNDHSVTISPRGTLIISTDNFASAGGWSAGETSCTFRFQKGDFFMIGFDTDSFARNTGEGEKVSYNFLTNKCQRTKYNVFDDKVKPVERWSKIPARPLKRLGDEGLPIFME